MFERVLACGVDVGWFTAMRPPGLRERVASQAAGRWWWAGLGGVVAGPAGRWPYRRRPVVLGGVAVLMALLVAVPVGTLFSSAGFGTRGEGRPDSVVKAKWQTGESGRF
jgi:hypothetical protein